MNNRGLTLLEVLAATVLLAAMAAACVPMLVSAARLAPSDSNKATSDTHQLAASVGKLTMEERFDIRPGAIPLDDLPEGVVHVSVLQQSVTGCWLVCTWRQGSILLWQPVDDSEAAQSSEFGP